MRKSESVYIKVATADDAWGVQEVLYQAWLATYPNVEHGVSVEDIEDRFSNRHEPERIARRAQMLTQPDEGVTRLIAKDGSLVVGVCIVRQADDHNELQVLYILPSCHRRGIGGRLWKEGLNHLNLNQYTLVKVAIYNFGAIEFYRQLGFEHTGKRVSDPRFRLKSGVIIPELEMRLGAPQ